MTRPAPRRRAAATGLPAPQAVVRLLARTFVAALLVFHGWLLSVHVSTGKLFEPDVAVRWMVAVGIFGAFLTLRRVGVSVFTDRRAAALWLLVVLLHCHAAWTGDALETVQAIPQAVVDLMPAGVQAAAALAGVILLAWVALRPAVERPRWGLLDTPVRFAGMQAAAWALPFSPRPPPRR
jgi:hypothetical protein